MEGRIVLETRLCQTDLGRIELPSVHVIFLSASSRGLANSHVISSFLWCDR